MNKKDLSEIARITDALQLIKDRIQSMHDEATERYDNMSEAKQETEAGQKANAIVDSLESAATSMDEVIDYLEDAAAQ